jgi:hypothetical protein
MDEPKQRNRLLGKIIVGSILGIGRIVYGIFRFIFAVLSALA